MTIMRCLLVILVVVMVMANAQFAFGGMPMGGMNGVGMMGGGGGPGGMSGAPYGGGMGGGGGGHGAGWGRRRMMGGMMNPYMGMMYGR